MAAVADRGVCEGRERSRGSFAFDLFFGQVLMDAKERHGSLQNGMSRRSHG
jgi:hypothetical protein